MGPPPRTAVRWADQARTSAAGPLSGPARAGGR